MFSVIEYQFLCLFIQVYVAFLIQHFYKLFFTYILESAQYVHPALDLKMSNLHAQSFHPSFTYNFNASFFVIVLVRTLYCFIPSERQPFFLHLRCNHNPVNLVFSLKKIISCFSGQCLSSQEWSMIFLRCFTYFVRNLNNCVSKFQ